MAIAATPATRHETLYDFNANVVHGLKVQVGTIAFDSSYISNGGESITFAGMTTPMAVWLPIASGYGFEYVVATKKIKAYGCSSGASAAMNELATGTDLSGLSQVPYIAFGFV